MTTALDHAVHAHLAHPAMGCDDAYTEALCSAFAPQPDLPDDAAAGPPLEPMWGLERSAPWTMALLYALALLLGLLGHHLAGWVALLLAAGAA